MCGKENVSYEPVSPKHKNENQCTLRFKHTDLIHHESQQKKRGDTNIDRQCESVDTDSYYGMCISVVCV